MANLKPAFSALLVTVLAAVAGYYVGKSSGLGAADRLQRLKERDSVVMDDNFSSGKEEETEDSDDEDSDKSRGSRGKGKGNEMKEFDDNNEDCKLVLVVRTDLGMSKGKIAAQCGHATLMCYKAAQKLTPRLVKRWETYGQTKIALQVKDEDEMVMLQVSAESLGVVARVVHDAGRTQIQAGSATVLGIGPAPRSVVDQIAGHLKLL